MPEEESRHYQINISANRFSISSPHGEEHVREVEKYLDSQIKEVSAQTEAYSPSSIALLVALNLADKLLTLQKKVSKYDGIEDDLESLWFRLDKVLEEK